MSKITSFPVDCACALKKSFRLPVIVEEEKKNEAMPTSLQISCPFRNEAGCASHLTVQLPGGYQLKKGDKTIRNGDIF